MRVLWFGVDVFNALPCRGQLNKTRQHRRSLDAVADAGADNSIAIAILWQLEIRGFPPKPCFCSNAAAARE
jgi:hypothetical protein